MGELLQFRRVTKRVASVDEVRTGPANEVVVKRVGAMLDNPYWPDICAAALRDCRKRMMGSL